MLLIHKFVLIIKSRQPTISIETIQKSFECNNILLETDKVSK